MMSGAVVPDDLRSKVALEAISCVTQLDGLVVVEAGVKIAMRMYTCLVRIFPGLRNSMFGEKPELLQK